MLNVHKFTFDTKCTLAYCKWKSWLSLSLHLSSWMTTVDSGFSKQTNLVSMSQTRANIFCQTKQASKRRRIHSSRWTNHQTYQLSRRHLRNLSKQWTIIHDYIITFIIILPTKLLVSNSPACCFEQSLLSYLPPDVELFFLLLNKMTWWKNDVDDFNQILINMNIRTSTACSLARLGK